MRHLNMLRQKGGREQESAHTLENEAPSFQVESDTQKEDNAAKKRWQKCHGRRNESFSAKKRKKARRLLCEFFYDCFCAPVDVLYYGCLADAEYRAST